MLANTLTVEDEESVQDELKALQQEAVCSSLFASSVLEFNLVSIQRGEEEPQKPIVLPSVPETKPQPATPQRTYLLFVLLRSSRLLTNSCRRNFNDIRDRTCSCHGMTTSTHCIIYPHYLGISLLYRHL